VRLWKGVEKQRDYAHKSLQAWEPGTKEIFLSFRFTIIYSILNLLHERSFGPTLSSSSEEH